MNNNLKRIIAREGLIILSLSIIVSISLFASNRFVQLSNPEFSRAKLQEFKDLRRIVLDKDSFIPDTPIHYQTIATVVKDVYPEYADVTDKELAEKVSIKYKLKVSYEESQTDKFKRYSRYCDIAFFFFLFIAYPVYLISRFAVWAVKVLRKPEL